MSANESSGSSPLDLAKAVIGSTPVGMIAGTTDGVGQFLRLFSGTMGNLEVVDGKIVETFDVALTINTVSNSAKALNAFNTYLNSEGRKGDKVKTVGDLTEALVNWANFKDDVEKGDGPAWAAIKSYVISKAMGWIAEKIASGLISEDTPIADAGKALAQGGDTQTAKPEHGLGGQLMAAIQGALKK